MNIGTNVQDVSRKLVWALAGLSVTSCLIRNDYNVLFAFLILIIINKYYVENTKFYTKIIVHILVALIVVDIFWLIVIMPYWNSNYNNEYWNKLSTMRSFCLFIAFLQLFLKVGIAGYLVYDYKQKNPEDFMEIAKVSYTLNNPKVNQSNLGVSNINADPNVNTH